MSNGGSCKSIRTYPSLKKIHSEKGKLHLFTLFKAPFTGFKASISALSKRFCFRPGGYLEE